MSATLSPTSSPRVRRRGSTRRPRAGSHLPPFTQESHDAALYAIRTYLKGRTSYDTFPVSFRLIVLDSKLEVKKALQCLLLNGVPIVPRSLSPAHCIPFNSPRRGLGTIMEQRKVVLRGHVHRLGHHPSHPVLLPELVLRCSRGRRGDLPPRVTERSVHPLSAIFPCNHPHIDTDIEKQLGVAPPPLLREHPSASLFDAAKLLIQTHARRVPLLDVDSETGHEVIISILTQYRLLKFISINVSRRAQTRGLLAPGAFSMCSNSRFSVGGRFSNFIYLFANWVLARMSVHHLFLQMPIVQKATIHSIQLPRRLSILQYSTSYTCSQKEAFLRFRLWMRRGLWSIFMKPLMSL